MRLWASNPGNRSQRRRSLLSLKAGLAAGAATPANLTAAQSGRRLASDGDDDSSASGAPLRLFQDPYLQAAVAAAAAAEAKAAAAAAEAGPEPDKADALSADPVAAALAAEQEAAELNPLQLDAMLLAAARYGSMALAAEIADGEYDPAWLEEFASNVEGGGGGDEGGDEGGERAPAQAVPGSLDYYLYGDSRAVDSGADYSEWWGGEGSRAGEMEATGQAVLGQWPWGGKRGLCALACISLLHPLEVGCSLAGGAPATPCQHAASPAPALLAPCLRRRVPQERPHPHGLAVSACCCWRHPNHGQRRLLLLWLLLLCLSRAMPCTPQGPCVSCLSVPRGAVMGVCSVSAVGDGWIELERPLPWDMREQWAVRRRRRPGSAC